MHLIAWLANIQPDYQFKVSQMDEVSGERFETAPKTHIECLNAAIQNLRAITTYLSSSSSTSLFSASQDMVPPRLRIMRAYLSISDRYPPRTVQTSPSHELEILQIAMGSTFSISHQSNRNCGLILQTYDLRS